MDCLVIEEELETEFLGVFSDIQCLCDRRVRDRIAVKTRDEFLGIFEAIFAFERSDTVEVA
ncbi:hypothetical protein EXE43_15730 [Halorubrum sp. SS5]|uniref:hypothetical protein n=1 Tax=Halorubrum sp. SS7 TaxID=2518119 RepID=UPI0010F96470|nr:hypothetical protein [Halorubrum sp. SS7]TKX57121.1 hypothetical protein EXE44_12010 [Halorubrum sp. SS7]TKX85035.1 hypothetical protein EXE43_15730 [Halorubrum sp. SS5]